MLRAGGVPGRRVSFARNCTGICVDGSASRRSWSASSTIRRLGMPPPHESHHLLARVITEGVLLRGPWRGVTICALVAANNNTATRARLDLPRFPGRFLFAWVAVAAGHAQPCLILHRAQVTKRGVPPGPVVHRLDPPEHLQAGLLPRAPVAPVDQLALQRRKE